MEKLPPERSETEEEKNSEKTNKSDKGEKPFRNLARNLLRVRPEDLAQEEKKWKELKNRQS